MLEYKDESILVIGEGTTDYKVNIINEIRSLKEIEKYGLDSQLYEAYDCASVFKATTHFYVLNMRYDTDYPEIIESLIQSDFTYIVPINIRFSDKIYIESEQKKIPYAEFLLKNIKDSNLSTIIMTDNHASLYNDIDQYINDMEAKINLFKDLSIGINTYGRNLVFIANNLVDYSFANVVAACMLKSSPYKDYPLQDCGEAVFDIDKHDVRSKEFAFFKYNIKRSATIENFNNFSTLNDQDKYVPINRVIKYIQRYLDLSEFCGKTYNEYLKVLIVDKLDALLSALVNYAITDYNIISCEFINDTHTKTIIVLNEISITPINSIEKYKLYIEA